MLKEFLIYTDFSETSRNALIYAMSYFKDIKASGRVILLNTYQIPPATPDQLVQLNDELRKKSRTGLERELREAQARLGDEHIVFDMIAHMGTMDNVIRHLVRKRGIQCIIIGSNNGHDIAQFGDTGAKLLVVRRNAIYPEPCVSELTGLSP